MVIEAKSQKQVYMFLGEITYSQLGFEQNLNKLDRKKNGVFLTNSLSSIENILNIIKIDLDIFTKRILEPSCGQGIFILKLISDVYLKFPDEELISTFITNSIYFVDKDKEMVKKTISNIELLYHYLFNKNYKKTFNAISWDFTDKTVRTFSLFEEYKETPFDKLYNTFDYIVGNPPYVTLYGRRDKKENEAQRISYLKNYSQFPDSVKNGKINLIMLFLEHSLDFLKPNGKLSFIIDVSFFETAYEFTRKYLLEKTKIEELQVNIKDFDVASGQVILKVTKSSEAKNNKVKIIDHRIKSTYFVNQESWYNRNDEYKFRYNGCNISTQILDKAALRKDKTLLQLYPNKNLRTCVMLLDMEDKFTFSERGNIDKNLIYPYYQGSKSLSEKYGKLYYKKYFFYNKPLQDSINDELRIELEKQGVKNKKRLGLGETVVYDNPKIFIRQSAKEIIATVDLERSSANNSLYVFSLRNKNVTTINFLYFLCGFLNSNFVTFYAQQMNIIRFSAGKQPQIKIGDLGSIFIPSEIELQNKISDLCQTIFANTDLKQEIAKEINNLVYGYYKITVSEIEVIEKSIRDF